MLSVLPTIKKEIVIISSIKLVFMNDKTDIDSLYE